MKIYASNEYPFFVVMEGSKLVTIINESGVIIEPRYKINGLSPIRLRDLPTATRKTYTILQQVRENGECVGRAKIINRMHRSPTPIKLNALKGVLEK